MHGPCPGVTCFALRATTGRRSADIRGDVSAPAVSVSGSEARRDPNIFIVVFACAALAAQLLVIGSLITGRAPALLAFVAATVVLQVASVFVIRRYAGRAKVGVADA